MENWSSSASLVNRSSTHPSKVISKEEEKRLAFPTHWWADTGLTRECWGDFTLCVRTVFGCFYIKRLSRP